MRLRKGLLPCSSPTAQHIIACTSLWLPNMTGVQLGQGCPGAAGKLMDAANGCNGAWKSTAREWPLGKQCYSCFKSWPCSCVFDGRRTGSLPNKLCGHVHSYPTLGKLRSKASSVEFLLPTIFLEIAPLPEEFANNNDWPLFKTLAVAGGRWLTTKQSAEQSVTIQMWLDQIQGSIRCGTAYRLDHISHKPH